MLTLDNIHTVAGIVQHIGYLAQQPVFAEGMKIGKIAEVLDYPGNSVYVVRGEYEYMIPAVKQFILSTDMEKNEMQVRLIEGMGSHEN